MANAAESAPANASAPGPRGHSFLHEVWVELQKTVWPTWPEAWRLTVVVMAVIIALGIFVAVIDYGFSQIFNHLIK